MRVDVVMAALQYEAFVNDYERTHWHMNKEHD